MVCRENPGRSAIMGWIKKRGVSLGFDAFHDAEIQSSQHEFKHELDGMTAMTTAQQIQFIESAITQVEADPNLTDGEKYRPNTGRASQTGIVTRLRAEISALQTGVDRNGNPIAGTVKQNTPADLASIMRMGSLLDSMEHAKLNFLETNARHRGIPMKQARAEWDRLMNQKGDFSQISLKDTFRDNLGAGARPDLTTDTRPVSLQQTLAMAGMTARDQRELGQSGRSRNAMAVMEQRRLNAIAAQPTQSTLDHQNAITRNYINPKQSGGYIKCDDCGQFGHNSSDCPNGDLVSQRANLDEQKRDLQSTRMAGRWRAMLTEDDERIADRLATLFPGRFDSVSAFREMAETKITELSPHGELTELQLQRRERDLRVDEAAVQREFDSRGGSASWVKTVRYSPQTGLLEMTPHDYIRKDGTVTPGRPFYRRISADEWNELTDGTDSFGKRLNDMGFVRRNQNNQFESAADLESAKSLTKCPTCGQFAALNAYHRCPVVGGPSEHYPARKAAADKQYRLALREGGGRVPPRPRSVTETFPTEGKSVAIRDADGTTMTGSLVTATPGSVATALSGDGIAKPAVRAQYPGATVTGNVRLWRDNDQALLTVVGRDGKPTLKCTCEQYRAHGRCPHIQGTLGAMAQKYQARPAGRNTPDIDYDANDGLALDAPIGPHSRLDYATLTAHRADNNDRFLHSVAQRAHAQPILSAPVTMPPATVSGDNIPEPTTWSREEAANDNAPRPADDVDLTDTGAVVHRIRKVLSGRPPRRSYSVRTAGPDGQGIVIDIQRSAQQSPALAAQQRQELRNLLGLNHNTDLQGGFYIPPTGSARYETLDRVYGDDQRIHQSRWLTDTHAVDRARHDRQRFDNRNLV